METGTNLWTIIVSIVAFSAGISQLTGYTLKDIIKIIQKRSRQSPSGKKRKELGWFLILILIVLIIGQITGGNIKIYNIIKGTFNRTETTTITGQDAEKTVNEDEPEKAVDSIKKPATSVKKKIAEGEKELDLNSKRYLDVADNAFAAGNYDMAKTNYERYNSYPAPSKRDMSSNIRKSRQCDSLLKRADEKFKNKKYVEAKSDYSQILTINAKDPKMKSKIAECERNLKQYGKQLNRTRDDLLLSIHKKRDELREVKDLYNQTGGGNIENLIAMNNSIKDDYVQLRNCCKEVLAGYRDSLSNSDVVEITKRIEQIEKDIEKYDREIKLLKQIKQK